MKLSNRIMDILEKEGFAYSEVYQEDSACYVEISKHTPEGEDWHEAVHFDGTDSRFVEELRIRYEDFDVDEEVEVWIDLRGQNGVPSSIRALLEDAEWKRQELQLLLNELERGRN